MSIISKIMELVTLAKRDDDPEWNARIEEFFLPINGIREDSSQEVITIMTHVRKIAEAASVSFGGEEARVWNTKIETLVREVEAEIREGPVYGEPF